MVAKIGVLDSGVGGLSVLREIHRLLPGVPTIYYADQGHVPYGPRPAHEIRAFVEDITRFLISQGAATIVLACNAASAASLEHLRVLYPDLPIVGMEPAVKPAAEATQTGVIGVLTTQATANGTLYRNLFACYSQRVRIITQVAPELVRIVEENSQHTAASRQIIADYLAPMLDAGADQIALACTHFPFLIDTIREIAGEHIGLIDPGPAVARQVARVFPRQNTAPGDHTYFTSGSPEHLREMLKTLLRLQPPLVLPSPSPLRSHSGFVPQVRSAPPAR